MTKRIIEVVPYQSEWPEQFEHEKAKLQEVFGKLASKIEHIGSTSIPGLAAKPIIDMVIEVNELAGVDELTDQLAAIGYRAKGENGIVGRRYFQKGGDQRTHHMHVFEAANPHLRNHILFKRYLIENEAVALEYGELKKRAAFKCNHDSSLYMALKDEFIKKHLAIALDTYDK